MNWWTEIILIIGVPPDTYQISNEWKHELMEWVIIDCCSKHLFKIVIICLWDQVSLNVFKGCLTIRWVFKIWKKIKHSFLNWSVENFLLTYTDTCWVGGNISNYPVMLVEKTSTDGHDLRITGVSAAVLVLGWMRLYTCMCNTLHVLAAGRMCHLTYWRYPSMLT